MLLLQISDKCRINIVRQDDRILSLCLEHIDILALLYLIGYIENPCLLRLFFSICIRGFCLFWLCFCLSISCFWLFILCSLFFCSFFHLSLAFGFFDDIFQCQILMLKILIKHGIFHLLTEFFIFQASKLDERTDIVPVFFIILTVCLKHAIEFICYFLRNIIRNFIYESIILQCTSWYIQRQIRAINDSFQYHQELRNHFFNIIGNKYLVVIQFDLSFNRFILCIDLREIKDSL